MYYVYALIDVRINLPFYIGKGKMSNNRHKDHFNESALQTDNRHKTFKINYLRNNGFDIPVEILVSNISDEKTAYDIEIAYIKQYGRANIDKDGILTNILLDSRAPPSAKGTTQSTEHKAKRIASRAETVQRRGLPVRSVESREALSKKMQGVNNPFYGKTHSKEFSKAQSALMKGNQFNSQEYIFTFKDGTKYQVTGFAKFCREHELTISSLEKGMQTGKWPKTGKSAGWQVEKLNLTQRN